MALRRVEARAVRPRGRGWLLTAALLSACIALAGCPAGDEEVSDEGVEDLTVVVEADKSRILEEEAKLQERKQSVESEAAALESQRETLRKQLNSLSKKDKAQRAKLEAEAKRVEEDERRMRQQLRNFEQERANLEREKNELLEKISTAVGTGGKGGSLSAVKADINKLNRNVASLDKKLTELEAASTKRHTDIMNALSDIAAKSGTKVVTYTPAVAASGGGSATKGQVVKIQRDVQKVMRKKGLLSGDLPPSAKSLDKEGTSALKSKDYGSAHASFSELQTIVNGIRVDQSFVQAKMTRINRVNSAKEGKLDAKQKAKLQKLLDEVSDAFSDGRYDRANKRINEIYQLLSSV